MNIRKFKMNLKNIKKNLFLNKQGKNIKRFWKKLLCFIIWKLKLMKTSYVIKINILKKTDFEKILKKMIKIL